MHDLATHGGLLNGENRLERRATPARVLARLLAEAERGDEIVENFAAAPFSSSIRTADSPSVGRVGSRRRVMARTLRIAPPSTRTVTSW